MGNLIATIKRDGLIYLLAGTLTAIIGCLEYSGRSYSSIDEHPGFVYPDKPPMVNRSSLTKKLVQMDNYRTVVWVMGKIDEQTPILASELSAPRDALRPAGVRVIGLYAGPSSHWRNKLLSMLRSARANFICAVIEPPAIASIANWLTQNPLQLKPGLYVLNENHQVIAAHAPTLENATSLVAELMSQKPESVIAGRRPETVIRARFRTIELSSGKVLANIISEAPDPEKLAGDIARQLSVLTKPAGTIAVMPIRQFGPAGYDQGAAQALGPLLIRHLSKNGYKSIVGPEKANQVLSNLDLSPIAIEFDPARLAEQVTWHAIIVGSITYKKNSHFNQITTINASKQE